MRGGRRADVPAFALFALRRVRRDGPRKRTVQPALIRRVARRPDGGGGGTAGHSTRWWTAILLVVVGAGLQAGPHAQTAAGRSGRLFPPQDLGLLEGPDREAWQKPDEIMDALGIADGSAVADIGAGAGWFTIRLARRVGPNGIVYAQDVQREMLEAIRRRVAREGLRNVETRLGSDSTPNLPGRSLDAVLVVDVYPEVPEPVTFLRNLAEALKPGGRIGIVNYKPGRGGPGPAPSEGVRVESTSVEDDARAAGLRVLARQSLPYQYLLILGRG